MSRSIVVPLGTFITSILLCSSATALQRTNTGGPPDVDRRPKNKLVFPYGVQTFEKKEFLQAGNHITRIPGWEMLGVGTVEALIAESPNDAPRPGSDSKRWISIEDFGAAPTDGFITPPIHAPAPWNYAWNFVLQVAAPPAGGDMPALAIQHDGAAGFQDAWGVRISSTGAELFLDGPWGTPTTVPLFSFAGATDVGQWVHIRVVASLAQRTMTAFVNGTEVAFLRNRVPDTTDVTRLRLAYHGSGSGNTATVLLDDVGVQFLNPLCQEDVNIDFTTEDDFATALVNGQDISTAPEFGNILGISGTGTNNGPVIFDSSDPGPNNPSQDLDLLLNQGNILILQTDAGSNPPPVAGVYPRPNDDEDGGTIDFAFNRPLTPLSIDLLDIDDASTDSMVLVLTDFSALTRTYTVPAGWTGDLSQAEPGVGTLDLQDTNPQGGFLSVATAVEDLGFDPNAVVALSVELEGSGGLDNLHLIIPCVQMTFEVEDDATPIFSGTALVDGQDLSTPPEFGIEVMISDAGANAGAAIFDSTPGGPNAGGPDNDLLVGLGNILCLQSNNVASHTTQTIAGIFDTPNDDVNGGDVFFDFPAPVHVHQIDLIDIDEEELTDAIVTLLDTGGKTRVFNVPPGWTTDILNDGGTGFGTLDLDTLLAQAGFIASATAVEDPGFDPDDVIQMTVSFGGAQDMDNVCLCPF